LIRLLEFQLGDQFFEQACALRGLGFGARAKLVSLVRLVLGGFFPENPTDGFPQRKLCSCPDGFAIGKAFSAQIVDLSAEVPQLFDCPGELVRCGCLIAPTRGFGGFCSCHKLFNRP
jgi:hypothetical protein